MELATPKKQCDLSRDQRPQAFTLRDVGWSYAQIAERLKITIRQVQYACTVGRFTLQKKFQCGPKSLINDAS